MRLIFLLQSVFFLVSTSPCFSVSDNQSLRLRFYESTDSPKAAKDFLLELQKDKFHAQPLIKGYTAALHMVMAKHAFNPYSKFRYFIEGRRELEEVLNQNPDIIELRLIRFAIQSNAPFFLNYYHNIKEDKSFLIQNIKKLNTSKADDILLKKYIVEYLFKSEYCTETEKQAILKA